MHDQTNNTIRAHKNFLTVPSLKKITILQLCSHNVCIFSNYSFKDVKIVNLISIKITMGVLRYNKFDYSFVNQ